MEGRPWTDYTNGIRALQCSIEKAIEYPNLYPIEEAPIITNKFAILACCTVALYIVFSAITLYLILTKKKTVVIESTDTPKNRTDEIKLLESFVSNSIQAENRSNWYKEDAYKANMNIPAGVLLLKNNNPQSEALVILHC